MTCNKMAPKNFQGNRKKREHHNASLINSYCRKVRTSCFQCAELINSGRSRNSSTARQPRSAQGFPKQISIENLFKRNLMKRFRRNCRNKNTVKDGREKQMIMMRNKLEAVVHLRFIVFFCFCCFGDIKLPWILVTFHWWDKNWIKFKI